MYLPAVHYDQSSGPISGSHHSDLQQWARLGLDGDKRSLLVQILEISAGIAGCALYPKKVMLELPWFAEDINWELSVPQIPKTSSKVFSTSVHPSTIFLESYSSDIFWNCLIVHNWVGIARVDVIHTNMLITWWWKNWLKLLRKHNSGDKRTIWSLPAAATRSLSGVISSAFTCWDMVKDSTLHNLHYGHIDKFNSMSCIAKIESCMRNKWCLKGYRFSVMSCSLAHPCVRLP